MGRCLDCARERRARIAARALGANCDRASPSPASSKSLYTIVELRGARGREPDGRARRECVGRGRRTIRRRQRHRHARGALDERPARRASARCPAATTARRSGSIAGATSWARRTPRPRCGRSSGRAVGHARPRRAPGRRRKRGVRDQHRRGDRGQLERSARHPRRRLGRGRPNRGSRDAARPAASPRQSRSTTGVRSPATRSMAGRAGARFSGPARKGCATSVRCRAHTESEAAAQRGGTGRRTRRVVRRECARFSGRSEAGMRELGVLRGRRGTAARSPSIPGRVVGAMGAAGLSAFVWKPDSGMADLNGSVPPMNEGLVLSEVQGVGELGQLIVLTGGGDHGPDTGDHTRRRALLPRFPPDTLTPFQSPTRRSGSLPPASPLPRRLAFSSPASRPSWLRTLSLAQSSVVGQWSTVSTWPYRPIHAACFPRTRSCSGTRTTTRISRSSTPSAPERSPRPRRRGTTSSAPVFPCSPTAGCSSPADTSRTTSDSRPPRSTTERRIPGRCSRT